MYADYLPSVKAYAEYYDSLELEDKESPRTIRGLAKIYKEEYKITKFDIDATIHSDGSMTVTEITDYKFVEFQP